MRLNRVLYILFLVSVSTNTWAQDKLTMQQAIEIGLKNNLDIVISKNQSAISTNDNTLGNAGMLPKVDLNASTNFATNDTKQEFSSGLIVDKSGVQSNNVNAGAYLSWTLFDGLKMFATHEKLENLQAIGELSLKIQIENILENIINSYYSIVKQNQLILGLKENIEVSEERLKIAQKKFELGAASKLEVLQAKVDKNAQTSNLLHQQTALAEYKINLNRFLSRPVDTEFVVDESIPVQFQFNYDDLKANLKKANLQLLYADKNILISNQVIKESRSELYPKLNLNANYLFARTENQAGFALLNQNLGLNLGLSASWTIFNGLRTNTKIKNAKLDQQIAKDSYTLINTQLEQQLLASFKKFKDEEKLLDLEEENVKLAKESVEVALERFRIGSSNSLELKDVQKNYDESLSRLAEAQYNAKLTETQLMKLNGNLLK